MRMHSSTYIARLCKQNQSKKSSLCRLVVCETQGLHMARPLAQVVVNLTVVVIIITTVAINTKNLHLQLVQSRILQSQFMI